MKKINKNFLFAVSITIIGKLLLELASVEIHYYQVIAIFFISYPYKIGGNIYSLFGWYNEKRSVYSLLSIIQVAEGNCFSLFVLGVQIAENDAYHLFGLSVYQKGKQDSGQVFGLSVYQKAKIHDNEYSIVVYKN